MAHSAQKSAELRQCERFESSSNASRLESVPELREKIESDSILVKSSLGFESQVCLR